MKTPSIITCLLGILCLSACGGWHLRGTGLRELPISTVNIYAIGASRVQQALQSELYYNNLRLVSRSAAEAIIEIADERFRRRILSVDPDTGKVREVELRLELAVTVRDSEERIVMPTNKMFWENDYVFDESSVLGTEAREDLLEIEMAKSAAQSLLIRLEAADFSSVQ